MTLSGLLKVPKPSINQSLPFLACSQFRDRAGLSSAQKGACIQFQNIQLRFLGQDFIDMGSEKRVGVGDFGADGSLN